MRDARWKDGSKSFYLSFGRIAIAVGDVSMAASELNKPYFGVGISRRCVIRSRQSSRGANLDSLPLSGLVNGAELSRAGKAKAGWG